MSYQVIARRWRPQSFNEVVFQDHVSSTIKNSISSGRISHAYIFTGPRGVGKTTTARILAKSLNCIEGPTPNPCGVCENCVEITEGRSFDVIEIDGASNNSVENIRDLREKVNFAPIKTRYKVYIIDEVHMLSTGAFNALLKTLEEPPPHVIFIFATTEIHKVPDTILSRCQKFYFKKIDTDHIVSHLKKISEDDGFSVQDKALYAIARAAGGSMRDAQSLLEQILSFSEDGSTDEEAALAILGVVSVDSYIRILTAVRKNDAVSVIKECSSIVSTGADIPRYADGLMEIIRTVRLVNNGIDVKNIAGYSEEEVSVLKTIGGQFCDEELSAFFKVANSLQNDLKFSDNERIHLEMALLDMITIAERPSLTDILQAAKNGVSIEKKKHSEKLVNPQSISAGRDNNKNIELNRNKPIPVMMDAGNNDNTGNQAVENNKENTVKDSKIQLIWSEFANTVKTAKPLLFQKIIKCKIKFDENKVILNLPEKNMGRIKISFDEDDRNYIFASIKKLTDKRFEIVYQSVDGVITNSDDIIPLPEKQMVEDVDHKELAKQPEVVKKLVDNFFGEVLEHKGDNKDA